MPKENTIVYEGWTHLTEGRDEIEQAFLAAGRENQLRFLPLASLFPLTYNIRIRTAVVALQ